MRPGLALPALVLLEGCTPAEPTFFEPAVFYVEGRFGYATATDQAVPFLDATDSVPPTLILTVASADWFDSQDPAGRCTIVQRHTDPEPLERAAWCEAAGAWFGFDMLPTDPVETDCTGWDPDVWGENPADLVVTTPWGLGIGPIDEDVEQQVMDAVVAADGQTAWDESWAPAVFGGGFQWQGAADHFDGGFAPNGYAYGLEVDNTFTLVVQDGSNLAVPTSDVSDGTIPIAAYTVQPWFGVEASLLEP